jgi:hypothetical protein
MKPLLQFVEECCLLAPNACYPAVELYLAYVHWSVEAGEPVLDQFTFVDLMKCGGLKYRERKRWAYFRGIAVLPRYRLGVAGGRD